MYPRGEITSLTRAKADLRARIAARRRDCCGALSRVVVPLGWIDLALRWRGRSPALLTATGEPAAVTFAAGLLRRSGPSPRIVRWLDAIDLGLSAVRLFRRGADGWIAATVC